MKKLSHTLLLWLGIEALYLGSLLLLPHGHFDLANFLSYSSQTLLLLLSISLVRHEPARRNKYIFLNFALSVLLLTPVISETSRARRTVVPRSFVLPIKTMIFIIGINIGGMFIGLVSNLFSTVSTFSAWIVQRPP